MTGEGATTGHDVLARMREGVGRALVVFIWVSVLAVMAVGWTSSAVSPSSVTGVPHGMSQAR